MLSREAWRLFMALEKQFGVGGWFGWYDAESVAPPCAITPSRMELSKRLMNELLKAGSLHCDSEEMKSGRFRVLEKS